MAKHVVIGGKVNIYKRENSDHWQCAIFMNGKNRRKSTKTDSLEQAKEIAEDWYLGLKGKKHAGILNGDKTFHQAADQFLREYEVITEASAPRPTSKTLNSARNVSVAVLRRDGPIRDHSRDWYRSTASIATNAAKRVRQAARPKHHAPRNRRATANP